MSKDTRSSLIAMRYVRATRARYGAVGALARARRLQFDRRYSHKPKWIQKAIEELETIVEKANATRSDRA